MGVEHSRYCRRPLFVHAGNHRLECFVCAWIGYDPEWERWLRDGARDALRAALEATDGR